MNLNSTPRRLRWTPMRMFGVAAVAAGATAWLWLAQAAWTSRYWQSQLSTVSDEEAPQLIERIVTLGDGGIDLLAEGLASPREAIRRESRLGLDDQMNRWARLPRDRASAKLALLAAALAERAGRLEPDSQLFAADLATRILLWPTDGSVVERGQIVADCETTLRAQNGDDDRLARRWTRDGDAVRSELAMADLQPSAVPIVSGADPDWKSLAAPDLPPLEGLAGETGDERVLAAGGEPRKLSASHLAARHISASSSGVHGSANQAAYLAAAGDQDDGEETSENANSAADQMRTREAIDLFGLLAEDDQTAAAAEAELTRRGFSRREIEAGQHLTSDDAEERRRWTEALPGMRGIDAKNWLLWMSQDRHPAVRRAAITLMATSQDPQMLQRVEQVSREDADPETRYQAKRLVDASAGDRLPPSYR